MKDILFDFDGTLVDSADCILVSYQELFDEFKITPEVELVKNIIGPPLVETLRLLTCSRDEQLLYKMSERFKAIYDDKAAIETLPYERISELLTMLISLGKRLYIATNKRSTPTISVIQHLKWQHLFHGIYSIDSLSDKKTKTNLLGKMMSEHQILPDEALYIGDRHDDAIAAENNNLSFLAVTWGYGEWEGTNYSSIKDPMALLEYL